MMNDYFIHIYRLYRDTTFMLYFFLGVSTPRAQRPVPRFDVPTSPILNGNVSNPSGMSMNNQRQPLISSPPNVQRLPMPCSPPSAAQIPAWSYYNHLVHPNVHANMRPIPGGVSFSPPQNSDSVSSYYIKYVYDCNCTKCSPCQNQGYDNLNNLSSFHARLN